MRRVAGHFVTVCTAVSLLLSVAACVLWAWSRGGSDGARWTYYRREAGGGAAGDSLEIASKDGRLSVTRGSGRLGRPGDIYWDEYYRQADASGGRPRLSFYHVRSGPSDRLFTSVGGPDAGTSGWGPIRWQSWGQNFPAVPVEHHNFWLGIPHWLAALLLAMLPAWIVPRRALRWRRARLRTSRGLCPDCGYDLRASPRRCPECGRAARATAA
jgi:hypothetical protein